MSATVKQEVLELEARAVEERDDPRAHPQTRLVAGERTWRPEMRTWVLANPWVRAVFVPDLGGRMISLEQSGVPVIPLPKLLQPVASWDQTHLSHVRDGMLHDGVQFLAPDRVAVRNASMSPVDATDEEPGEADEPVRIAMAGLMPGCDLGFQLIASVAPHRAEVLLEARIQHRGLEAPLPCWSAWGLPACGAVTVSPVGAVLAAYDEANDRGVALVGDPHRLAHFATEEWMEMGRPTVLLAPRQIDEWSLRVVPLAGLGRYLAGSPELFLGLNGQTLRLLSVGAYAGCRLFVLDDAGSTLEAPLDLSPGTVQPLELPCEPKGVMVRNAEGVELLRWTSQDPPATPRTALHSAAVQSLAEPAEGTCEHAYREAAAMRARGEDPTELLAAAADSPMLRPLAGIQAAMHALRTEAFEEAVRHLEDALGYNAEDALVWWLKAVAQRLAGDTDPEAPELPNAHFLSPLEPALRAEAFLAQGLSMAAEPNPLIAPLAAFPDHALEAVALILDCGLYGEAARLLDELLRHQEVPLLRRMLAYCHLKATGMKAEAAGHARRADETPDRGPKPWRPLELEAVEMLARL